MNINEVIGRPEYINLLNSEVFKDRPIMFVTFGGSHAYGTNVPDSDIDIRGCALNSKTDLIGLSSFEQTINNEYDFTVYGFNKLFQLLLNCNPNTIELLGCRKCDYANVSKAGQMLIDNAELFLSRVAVNSFGGYARQQLVRLKNAVARDRLNQAEQERHILDACDRALSHMNERYREIPQGSIKLYVDGTDKAGMDLEIYGDIDLKHYPLRDFAAIYRDLNDVSKNYSHLQHRNNKKDDKHLNKHMMHLIRLYIMGIDILENHRIVTYREKEHDLLMSIRNGAFMGDNGLVMPEFYEMLDRYTERFEYAKKNTTLPKTPDKKKSEELCMEINMLVLKG